VAWVSEHNSWELFGCRKVARAAHGRAIVLTTSDSTSLECDYCVVNDDKRCHGLVCAANQYYAWMDEDWARKERNYARL
jgi:hypothetical protein